VTGAVGILLPWMPDPNNVGSTTKLTAGRRYTQRRGAKRDAGADECFFTNGNGARDDLVLGPSRWITETAHYRLAVAARFLCLLSLRRQRK
jgi:hypothetical protein